MKILVLTVGGSPQPIISSITQSSPNKVVFLCSDDTPQIKGSYSEIENILKSSGRDVSDSETAKIAGFDDFNDCYVTSLRTLERICNEYAGAQVIADYTGGTKSMAAGLVAAALDCPGVTLGLVKGDRSDLIKVTNGTQSLRLSRASRATLERQKNIIKSFFGRFDYTAAISLLENILQITDLAPTESQQLQGWLVWARALDSWDRFDHAGAWRLIHHRRKECPQIVMFLEACIYSRRRLDEEFVKVKLESISETDKGHGYELIQDLFLNAQRRAAQGRYDDAVARLYRAIELLAQARLKLGYQINTGDVKLDNLPATLQGKYKNKVNNNGKIQLSLRSAYELLVEFNQIKREPFGQLFTENKNKIVDFLRIRNNSILAHGFTPVSEGDYKKAQTFFDSFLKDVFSLLSQAKMMEKPYTQPVQFLQSPSQ